MCTLLVINEKQALIVDSLYTSSVYYLVLDI